jgi:hypothetical protein
MANDLQGENSSVETGIQEGIYGERSLSATTYREQSPPVGDYLYERRAGSIRNKSYSATRCGLTGTIGKNGLAGPFGGASSNKVSLAESPSLRIAPNQAVTFQSREIRLPSHREEKTVITQTVGRTRCDERMGQLPTVSGRPSRTEARGETRVSTSSRATSVSRPRTPTRGKVWRRVSATASP